jgi:hypothetical protein
MKKLFRKYYLNPPADFVRLPALLRGIGLAFFLSLNLSAQTTLQVLTKNIEKTFENAPNVQIEAEKADIEIMTWDKPEIKVSLELIAKHPDRKTAAADLDMMKYVADKIGKGVFIRNYLVIENPKLKPTSNLKAKYIIRVPNTTNLTVQNNFGKISMTGGIKTLNLKTDFCQIELNKMMGVIKLNTHYGEVVAKDIEANLSIQSERSDLIISQLSGDCSINAQYGKLNINALKDIKQLKIDAQKSEININEVPFKKYNFKVEASYGKLKVPAEFTMQEDSRSYKVATLNLQLKSSINIKNSFGNITIEN